MNHFVYKNKFVLQKKKLRYLISEINKIRIRLIKTFEEKNIKIYRFLNAITLNFLKNVRI